MNDILTQIDDHVLILSFHRIHKRNAFDEHLLQQLQDILTHAEHQTNVHAVILKGNGPDFSAGADLHWMKRMASMNEEENQQDALKFAHVISTLYHFPKPTIAMVHGQAIGGGVGLVAACDIAIAADTAIFSFPEVKLGLIPAVISPYIIRAIGERAARWLFLSAEPIPAQRAYELQLIHHCLPEKDLSSYTLALARRITQHAPQALSETKQLIKQVSQHPMDLSLQQLTATWIAKKRVSSEAQQRLHAFLTGSSLRDDV